MRTSQWPLKGYIRRSLNKVRGYFYCIFSAKPGRFLLLLIVFILFFFITLNVCYACLVPGDDVWFVVGGLKAKGWTLTFHTKHTACCFTTDFNVVISLLLLNKYNKTVVKANYLLSPDIGTA